MTLILSRSDIDGLVPMRAVIDAVELAFADMARGTAFQPAPSTLSLTTIDARFLPMAAISGRQKLAAVKMLADIPENRGRNLPPQRSVIVVTSIETGECVAMLDGMLVTRQRTAAASAVASRHLARPDSKVLGLVGAGGLAASHIQAMLEVLPIEQVLVWSRSPATLEAFIEGAGARFPHLGVQGAASPKDVVQGSDVVCTLTPGKAAIISGEWFQPGLHLNAVGAPPRPDHREIDGEGMARATVFVDSMATVMHESGDLLLAIADGALNENHIVTELGDVIAGRAAGRTNRDEITLYDSVGVAMQDLVTAHLIVRAAQATGIGIDFEFAR